MKYTVIIYGLMLVGHFAMAQPPNSKAGKLRNEGRLSEAIEVYKSDFDKSPDNWRNTYDLACAYALTYQIDSAFSYLRIALKNDKSLWTLADTDLLALHEDPRWTEIENTQIEKIQASETPMKAPAYAKELLQMITKDQALDYYVDQAKSYYMKEGSMPFWYYPLGAQKQKIGSENFAHMKELIAAHGWKKYSNVGKLAADAPLLVINHHENDSVRTA